MAQYSSEVISAENIALFSLLHGVPVRPSTNKASRNSWNLPAQQTNRQNYSLSFDTERRLADTLAFLSSIKDDPDHIPAICVGEDPDEKNSLNVYIAINKCRWGDGDDLLQTVKDGFEQLFRILEKCSFPPHHKKEDDEYGDRRKVKEQVFSAVVSMCSSRILARLSLGPRAKLKAKKDFKKGIVEVIDFVNRQRNDRNQSTLSLFTTKARELVKLVDLWTKYQTQTPLEDLVEGVYQLQKTETVQRILDGMSNRDMDPLRRASLLNVVKKVARYRQAARFLYRLVAKEQHLSKLKAIAVNLPKEYFEKSVPSSVDYYPRLSSVLFRIHPKYAKEKSLGQIRRLLLTKKEKSVDEDFSERVLKTLNEAKIHAEVQLIAHCESQLPGGSMGLPPRVICSSKDACYLCNLAIYLYRGKMHTPRSHGRLYPGWRLPLQQHQQLGVSFNQAIETKIKESLMFLFQKQQRINYPFPMESTLGTLPSSNTTLYGSSIRDESVISRIGLGHEVPVRTLLSVGNQEPTGFKPGEKSKSRDLISDIRSQDSHLSNEDEMLPRGIALKKTIKPQNAPFVYSNGLLEVQMDLEPPDPSKLATNQTSLAYSIEWLDKAAEIQEKCHSGCVIDVGTLQGEVFHEICGKNSLYMRFENSVFRLRFH